MYRKLRITVCLPCRNEAKHLGKVIAKIPKFVDEIIVISNKSSDNTLQKARQYGAKALEDNRTIGGIGYGYAHMTGIENATGDIIVGADGDATYPIEDLGKIIDYLIDKKLDFVACNRYPLQHGTKIPLKLRLGVGILNKEVHILYGLKIQDILSGMWVFRADIRPKLNLSRGDWNLCPQIKLNILSDPSIKFGEYSIGQHGRMGESHQRYFRTGISHATWILKHRLTYKLSRRPKRALASTANTKVR
jgi:glycosyltransferase involved in cell wall biosynthesis